MRCLTPRRPASITGQHPGTCRETLRRDMSFSHSPAFAPQSWQGSPHDHADNTDASGRTGTSGGPPAPDLAGPPLPARGDLRRLGNELRPLLLGRHRCRPVPVRRRGPRGAGGAQGGRRRRLARLPARDLSGSEVRLPGGGPLRPGLRSPLRPLQAAAGPLRQGDLRRGDPVPDAVLLLLRQPGGAQRGGLGGPHHALGGHQPLLRLGSRPSPEPRVPRDDHL